MNAGNIMAQYVYFITPFRALDADLSPLGLAGGSEVCSRRKCRLLGCGYSSYTLQHLSIRLEGYRLPEEALEWLTGLGTVIAPSSRC